jgi:hypothetical protein
MKMMGDGEDVGSEGRYYVWYSILEQVALYLHRFEGRSQLSLDQQSPL